MAVAEEPKKQEEDEEATRLVINRCAQSVDVSSETLVCVKTC